MIKFKNLTLRNFFSVGQVTQSVNIDEGFVTLILGSNPDYGEGIRNGVGKAQPMYSKIRTPYGWKTMKDIDIGDFVLTPKGTTSVVMGKYPQGKRTVYEIKTHDGKTTHCCKEHLWNVYMGDDYKTVDTREIYDAMKSGVHVKLPVVDQIGDKESVLPTCPYALGLYLACGSIENGGVLFKDVSYEVFHKLKVYMPESLYDYNYVGGDLYMKYRVDNLCPLIKFVTDMCLDEERYIPVNYMDSSYYQRRDLMMGFNDARGEQDEEYVVSFFGDDEKRLAKDLQRIAWSLSGVSNLKFIAYTIRDKTNGVADTEKDIILRSKYPDANKLFSLEFKKDFPMQKNLCSVIKSIKTVEKQDVACIKIADDDALYITDDYIPTHNTTVINGLSYALYGDTITTSKKDDLVNNVNGKHMMVSLDFEANGVDYRIERGRKPNKLRLIKLSEDDESIVSDDFSDDEDKNRAHGENKDTQREINNLIQMNYLLFKFIVAMNTYSTHFMSSSAAVQREVIEQILGIDALSKKAQVLADRIKQTKIDIDKEEIRIETLQQSNDRILRNIENLKEKSDTWERNKNRTIAELMDTLKGMGDLDIDGEIEKHTKNAEIREVESKVKLVKTELKNFENNKSRLVRELNDLSKQMNSFDESICPTCKQSLNDEESHEKHKTLLTEDINSKLDEVDEYEAKIKEYQTVIDSITIGDEIQDTFYRSVDDAYNHKNTMETLISKVEDKQVEENPYSKQIEELETGDLGIQEIDYSNLKSLEKKLSHEKFLQKLLTNRDSFVRKRIIDYSLPFLNKVFQEYIDSLSLPHQVVFDPNLTFSITDKGREVNFNNLSRGEQNRVTFALNIAFRDLYENLVNPINCLFVDEILDFGMDSVGAKDAVEILKSKARDFNKAVYLVTHKEELVEHVDKTILVKKENGFTTYEHIDT